MKYWLKHVHSQFSPCTVEYSAGELPRQSDWVYHAKLGRFKVVRVAFEIDVAHSQNSPIVEVV